MFELLLGLLSLGDVAKEDRQAALVRIQAVFEPAFRRRIKVLEGPRGPVTVKVTGTFSSNSALALRKAAIAGLGAALLPRYVVADDLASGILVTLFPRHRVAARPLIAVYPRAPETPLKVRAFVTFITEWLASRGGNLTSRVPSLTKTR